MGGTSEREFKEKVNKIRDRLSKRIKEVGDDAVRIEKIKMGALDKIEDMRRSAAKEADKVEKDMLKSRDLAPESKQRLTAELTIVRSEIQDSYAKLQRQIAETLVPKVT
jgi:hypothetical protein